MGGKETRRSASHPRKELTTNGRLNFAARQGGLLVVSGKLSGFGGNALENVIDERVHNGHSLLGDTSIRVDLLEDLVNVGRVGFDTLLLGTAARFLSMLNISTDGVGTSPMRSVMKCTTVCRSF